jgi:hypothetical protein
MYQVNFGVGGAGTSRPNVRLRKVPKLSRIGNLAECGVWYRRAVQEARGVDAPRACGAPPFPSEFQHTLLPEDSPYKENNMPSAPDHVRILRLGTATSRRACDRCHGHKLRCPRDSDDATCLRCQRARVSCLTGSPARMRPRTRSSVPREDFVPWSRPKDPRQMGQLPNNTQEVLSATSPRPPKSVPPTELDTACALATEMPLVSRDPLENFMGFNSFPVGTEGLAFIPETLDLGFESADQQSAQVPASGPLVVPSPTVDTELGSSSTVIESWSYWNNDSPRKSAAAAHQTSPIDASELAPWVRKLSNLTVRLHEHLQSIPPVGVWQEMWEPTEIDSTRRDLLRRDKELTLDQTLQLSQEFTELLNYAWPCFRNQITNNQVSSLPLRSKPHRKTPSVVLDQPAQLLVFTGYLSIVEAYDKLLQHINACANFHQRNFRLQEEENNDNSNLEARDNMAALPMGLPTMQIGRFEMTAASSVQVAVLIHVMESMMARMRRLVGAMTDTTAQQHQCDVDGKVDVTRATIEALQIREKSTMQLLESVRQMVVHCGVL